MKVNYLDLAELEIDWSDLQLIKRRQRKETLREVYFEDERYVFKRFIINRRALFYPRPWLLEARGLIWAQGLHTPEFQGLYAGMGACGQREFVLKRTLVPGPCLKGLPSPPLVESMAELLAKLHERGIITRDATPGNFLIRPDGTPFIIDMGKARIYRHHPYYGIGSELARFVYSVLNFDEGLWRCFIQRYYATRSAGPASRAIEQFYYRLCKQNRLRRRGPKW